jgi:hypothetical protein
VTLLVPLLAATLGVGASPACKPLAAWVDVIVFNTPVGSWGVSICRGGQVEITGGGRNKTLRLSEQQLRALRALVTQLPSTTPKYTFGVAHVDVRLLQLIVRGSGVQREYNVGDDLTSEHRTREVTSVADVIAFAGELVSPEHLSDVRQWFPAERGPSIK